MKLKSLLLPDPERYAPIALLIVRASAGLLLVPHGYAKLFGGLSGFAEGLAARGYPAPFVLALCAGLGEFAGGLGMAFGFLTRPAALSAALTMIVAWSTTHLADAPKIGSVQGTRFEYPFLLSLIAIAIAISGPGRYSLDERVFGKKSE